MIHVEPQPEPGHFHQSVRQPGQRFQEKKPEPHGKEWKSFDFWTRISNDLHDCYGGICAYSCHWIPYDTGWRTVEHFKPKDHFPQLAYEWSNYRLVCGILNGRKGLRDLLDPFQIQDGWFVIDFPSLNVRPGEDLDESLAAEIQTTIEILGLNDKGTCFKSRRRYTMGYCNGEFPFSHLVDEAPFLASELNRQGLVESIAEIMLPNAITISNP